MIEYSIFPIALNTIIKLDEVYTTIIRFYSVSGGKMDFEDQRECPNCGTLIEDEEEVECQSCGHNLIDDDEPL